MLDMNVKTIPDFVLTPKSYEGEREVSWCPGCGDFGILSSVKQALAQLKIAPHEAFFVSGIGCGSKLPDYLKANGAGRNGHGSREVKHVTKKVVRRKVKA